MFKKSIVAGLIVVFFTISAAFAETNFKQGSTLTVPAIASGHVENYNPLR